MDSAVGKFVILDLCNRNSLEQTWNKLVVLMFSMKSAALIRNIATFQHIRM